MFKNPFQHKFRWNHALQLQKWYHHTMNLFQASGEKPETMTSKDAAMFPIIASCTLFGIYLVFQVNTC